MFSSTKSTVDLNTSSMDHQLRPSGNEQPHDGTLAHEGVIDGTSSQSKNTSNGSLARTAASTFQSPNFQPHQHATLFYLSLIEGRCRTQAATSINTGRRSEDRLPENHPEVYNLAELLFVEMSKELSKAGMLPPEVPIPSLQELRRYLASFDTILHNAVLQQPANIFDRSERGVIEDSNHFSINRISESSLFERSNSQALIPQNFAMVPGGGELYQNPTPIRSLMVTKVFNNLEQESLYNRKFKETAFIAKGGQGEVWRARHFLDGQEYAIKTVRIKVRTIHDERQAEALLCELRALAKLQHRNVVRYFDSWHEKCPSSDSSASLSQRLLGAEAYNSELSDSDDASGKGIRYDLESHMSGLQVSNEHFNLDIEQQLRQDERRVRGESFNNLTYDEDIIFGYSNEPSRTNNVADRSQQRTLGSKSLFRKASEISEDEEDDTIDTEEIERSESNLQQPTRDEDLVLFIQMALHPMTLQDYIRKHMEVPVEKETEQTVMHCFHTSVTARLLLAILDGIDYIHGQKIVHRDLKPANIFLSVYKGNSQPEGSIDITDCSQCSASSKQEHIYITPHIGDFGLIAKFDDCSSTKTTPAGNIRASPLAFLSSLASSGKQAGTALYIAPVQEKARHIICPKLDVYSFGVIAYEMTVRFGTMQERGEVLAKIRDGEVPGLENPLVEKGIKGMLHLDRERRWDCAQVRAWLCDILERT
ncbi:kinase-like domain-containing protein [Tricladium varicosporioides]|nr:kinase-like domain-containing protein [Hymenoscyphus varicosporioides]